MYIKNIVVKTLLIKTIFKALNQVNKVLAKDDELVMFYSNEGFHDNVKAVFDYMKLNGYNDRYKIVCSTNDYKNFKNDKNIKFVNTIKGIFYYMKSAHVFYSFGKIPIMPTKSQIVIQLWHGSPLKKILKYEDKDNHQGFYFNYVCAASDLFLDIMRTAFDCQKESVFLCGHPRNDVLYENNEIPEVLREYEKLVLWLPTFRKTKILDENYYSSQNAIPLLEAEDVYYLDKLLNENNTGLIIKFHPLQDLSNFQNKMHTNIHIYSHEEFYKNELDLYKLLSKADALITDYSSVYFDYLLLNRPIGFTVNDIEEYTNNKGFIFDNPLEYMPGYKIKNKDEFFRFIHDTCKGIDEYKVEREKVNKVVNQCNDNNNCKRILDLSLIK